MNKRKILNDPVYGFITIPDNLSFEIIEHPYFQRLRRIQQLGLTNYVYPGAMHTRFHHALGAFHLMQQALSVLTSKGEKISNDEFESALVAILLHDIGHGPFSHALENSLIRGISHEDLSLLFMKRLSQEFGDRMEGAVEIFSGQTDKPYLQQLVSGQLDVDRLDYLNRDSFFTGVHEGVIGYDRIIKMLMVHNGNIVVESKGIYSIEKFLIARRLMYWQVYLHKTVIAVEQMLLKILSRARELSLAGASLYSSPSLQFFLQNEITAQDFKLDSEPLEHFAKLDDFDIFAAIKVWCESEDKVLSLLCNKLVNRALLKIKLTRSKVEGEQYHELLSKVSDFYDLSEQDAGYFVFHGSTSNYAYSREEKNINILFSNGELVDIADASDQLNISVLAHPVVKYYLCYPKELIPK